METASEYRKRGDHAEERAKEAKDSDVRKAWLQVAADWRAMAIQADRRR